MSYITPIIAFLVLVVALLSINAITSKPKINHEKNEGKSDEEPESAHRTSGRIAITYGLGYTD